MANQYEELKPCPFCGGQPKEYDQIGYSSVKCKPCDFSIKVKSIDGPPYAPELWNRRAELSAIKGAQAGEAVAYVSAQDLRCFIDGNYKAMTATIYNFDHPLHQALYTTPRASGAVPVQEPEKGLEIAARFLEKRAQNYDEEHGCTDPETGTREYPGDGAEYYHELMEMADELRALLAKENTK